MREIEVTELKSIHFFHDEFFCPLILLCLQLHLLDFSIFDLFLDELLNREETILVFQ